MPSSFLDVCRFNPTAGGTTDWTYSSAVTGYQSPTAAGAVNGAIYSYRAESNDLSQWEVGFGAYNSGTGVFARTTVLFNSSGTTSKITFSTVPQVAIVALGEDIPSLTNANSFANATEATGAGTTAAGIFAGGVEILKKLFVTGIAKFTNATAATSTTTGAVVVTGGVGVGGAVVAGSAFVPAGDVASGPSMDVSGQAYTLAAGASKTVAASYSGLLIVTESTSTGSTAIFLLGMSTVTLVSQSGAGTQWVASSTPSSSQLGVYLNGGVNYQVKNGTAGSVNFYAMMLKTRPSP
jgi:hypothetical protein